MKALREWLHWATNETHISAETRAEKSFSLPVPESDLVDDVARHLINHANPDKSDADATEDITWCLEHHPQAFSDLCLEFARAIEKMRDLVPEAASTPEPEDECDGSDHTAEAMAYAMSAVTPLHMGRREGMSSEAWRDWVGPGAQRLIDAARRVNDQTGERDRRLTEMRRIFTEGRVVMGADWGVSNTTNVRANPVPTDFGDGAHAEDILCGCDRYIIRAGKFWADADAIHGQGRCSPTG